MTNSLASGIRGFETLRSEGLPSGRVSVVVGGVGCGKTIFGLQTVCAGDAPAIVVSFEEVGTALGSCNGDVDGDARWPVRHHSEA